MKIIWWTPGYPPEVGGIERLAALVLGELARRGHEVAAWVHTGDPEFEDTVVDGIEVHRIPTRLAMATRDLTLLTRSKRRIVELKKAVAPDVVHVHLSDPSVHLHLVTAQQETATVVTVHNLVDTAGVSARPNTLFARALESAGAITAVSDEALASAVAGNEGLRDRAEVIPNGIAMSTEPATDVVVDPPVVLAAGRLVAQKRVHIGLRAFAALRARRPDAKLRIAGDGPLRAELETLSDELGLAEAVTFLGRLTPEEMHREYVASSLVLMTSEREGMPLVALEAAAAGRPVIARKLPGSARVIADGRTGVLVDSDAPEDFARAMDAGLADGAAWRAMGHAAAARAQAEYSLDACVSAYERVYQRVVEAKR